MPVNVTTLESIAIVTAPEPLNDVPLNPVPIVKELVVFAVTVISADPLNDTPLIVLAVVNVAADPAVVADATDLTESAVLSTLPNPTSALTRVTTPVLPATLSTAPDVIKMYAEPDHR